MGRYPKLVGGVLGVDILPAIGIRSINNDRVQMGKKDKCMLGRGSLGEFLFIRIAKLY